MKSKGTSPVACPSCASSHGLREVLYGLPEFPVNEDRYILGGCCPGGPEWICISCDWNIEDPAGQGIEPVRVIRDEIKKRVEQLLSELLV